jgi:CO dehydrogenase/acetyl-CoA synthase gamma subunit (corrinoid Fe-S protein)
MPYKTFPLNDPELHERAQHIEEFKKFDRRELIKMDDVALAKWQGSFALDEPQWRLAEHEWQRRIIAEQITAIVKAARWQAWFGIAAAVIGALLTLLVQALSR